ncbi:hypothetical protein SFA35_00850 [Pseudomonas sp. HR96]|uniref:PA3496 family putative envelope integrity protein n=1 Tax=Pseudomonas sp. HR96 TaxID=1027966 RepID=UPI002A75B0E7|nr:hypothetical protein [Pseudomonas sp. HR96]WPO99976.1 hypothetical protein SFA35_00850 [Pseudomonas sp. HR96]
MARNHEDAQQPSSSKTRRQQEDQRRMEFRRAIESHSEQRRLLSEIADYPDLNYWQEAPSADHQNAQQAR